MGLPESWFCDITCEVRVSAGLTISRPIIPSACADSGISPGLRSLPGRTGVVKIGVGTREVSAVGIDCPRL